MGSWECCYMVIKHMRVFVETIQHDFIYIVSGFLISKKSTFQFICIHLDTLFSVMEYKYI
ncbi:hypothetical protein HanPI659440_Chr01g0017501 [Helianthus annuus]|nr:hypothetical protein HanPI659440_Chr01g0017501 [Helianthus annuus]